MKWFRFYSDALDDPKVQRLPGDLFKTWVNVLCLAAKNDGDLPCAEDMAFALRLSDEAMNAAIADFTQRGLMDAEGDSVTPHNWQGRQPMSDRDVTATERQQRRRSRVSNTDVTDVSRVTNESVTPLDKIRLDKSRQDENREENNPHANAHEAESLAAGAALPQVVSSVNELTSDRPVDLVSALCDALGKPISSVETGWRKTQFGLAAQILEAGHSAEQVRRHIRYMQAETWRTNGIDLLDVKKSIGKWEANGAPTLPASRASPDKSIPRSAQVVTLEKSVRSGRGITDGNRNDDTAPHRTAAASG